MEATFVLEEHHASLYHSRCSPTKASEDEKQQRSSPARSRRLSPQGAQRAPEGCSKSPPSSQRSPLRGRNATLRAGGSGFQQLQEAVAWFITRLQQQRLGDRLAPASCSGPSRPSSPPRAHATEEDGGGGGVDGAFSTLSKHIRTFFVQQDALSSLVRALDPSLVEEEERDDGWRGYGDAVHSSGHDAVQLQLHDAFQIVGSCCGALLQQLVSTAATLEQASMVQYRVQAALEVLLQHLYVDPSGSLRKEHHAGDAVIKELSALLSSDHRSRSDDAQRSLEAIPRRRPSSISGDGEIDLRCALRHPVDDQMGAPTQIPTLPQVLRLHASTNQHAPWHLSAARAAIGDILDSTHYDNPRNLVAAAEVFRSRVQALTPIAAILRASPLNDLPTRFAEVQSGHVRHRVVSLWERRRASHWERQVLRSAFTSWRSLARYEATQQNTLADIQRSLAHARQTADEKVRLAKQAQARLADLQTHTDRERQELLRERELEKTEVCGLRTKTADQAEEIEALKRRIDHLEAKRVFLSSELQRKDEKLQSYFHQSRRLHQHQQPTFASSVGSHPIPPHSLPAVAGATQGAGALFHFCPPERLEYDPVDGGDCAPLVEGVFEMVEELLDSIAPIPRHCFTFQNVNLLDGGTAPSVADDDRGGVTLTLESFEDLVAFLVQRQQQRVRAVAEAHAAEEEETSGTPVGDRFLEECITSIGGPVTPPGAPFTAAPQPPSHGSVHKSRAGGSPQPQSRRASFTSRRSGSTQQQRQLPPTSSRQQHSHQRSGSRQRSFSNASSALHTPIAAALQVPPTVDEISTGDEIRGRLVEALMNETQPSPQWLQLLCFMIHGEAAQRTRLGGCHEGGAPPPEHETQQQQQLSIVLPQPSTVVDGGETKDGGAPLGLRIDALTTSALSDIRLALVALAQSSVAPLKQPQEKAPVTSELLLSPHPPLQRDPSMEACVGPTTATGIGSRSLSTQHQDAARPTAAQLLSSALLFTGIFAQPCGASNNRNECGADGTSMSNKATQNAEVPSFCASRDEPSRLAALRRRVHDAWLRGTSAERLLKHLAMQFLTGTQRDKIAEITQHHRRVANHHHASGPHRTSSPPAGHLNAQHTIQRRPSTIGPRGAAATIALSRRGSMSSRRQSSASNLSGS